jgi:hypothetical protein
MADRLFQRDFIQKLVLYAHSQEKRDAELLNGRTLKQQEKRLEELRDHIEWSMQPTPQKILAIIFITFVRWIFVAQSIFCNTIICLQLVFVFVVCAGPFALIMFTTVHPEKVGNFLWNVIVPFVIHQCRTLSPPQTCVPDEFLDQYIVQPGLYVAQAVCGYIIK